MNVNDLLAKLEEGLYALPEIQRPFVWNNRKVLELFDSIRNQLPIGSILVWNMPRQFVKDYGDILRPIVDDLENKKDNFQYMVIDGQQRLVSLYLVSKGRVKISKEERAISLYYSPVDNGVLKLARGHELDSKQNFFNVTKILNSNDLDSAAEEKKLNSSLRIDLETFKNALLNYNVNIYEVPESAFAYKDSGDFLKVIGRISETFVRINYEGTRIRMPDLLVAILTSKTRAAKAESFRSKLKEVDDYFSNIGWEIDETVLMRTYMAIGTSNTSFKEAREKLKDKKTDEILGYLDQTKEALKKTIDVMREQVNVKKPSFLKSKYSMVTLAYYLHNGPDIFPENVRSVKRWLILSSFNRRYTGRLESDLKEDIDLLSKNNDLRDLENNLTTRRLEETWFDELYGNEHLTTLAIILCDSYDLRKGELRRINRLAPEEIQIHHIFPKELLKKYYGSKVMIGNQQINVEDAYDVVANITLISKDANKAISDERPDKYLGWFSKKILDGHCIPYNKNLWEPSQYSQFLSERKKLLINCVSNVLDQKS